MHSIGRGMSNGRWKYLVRFFTVGEDSESSRQDGGISKLDCFIRFDEVNYWLSRTRDLITNAETYSYPAFWESFRELRRESRKAEFALVLALYQFRHEMEEQAPDVDTR
jgi:hypothetical protein